VGLTPGLAAAMFLGVPIAAHASVGTGVGASPIVLDRPAEPGHSYDLPKLYLVNTGSELAHYTVRVRRYTPSSAREIPSSWVAIGRLPTRTSRPGGPARI